MKLREFEIDNDFESMKNWVTDERMHAMWCANLIKYPLSKEHMAATMTEAADRFGDIPYVAISDDGRVDGFFCYSYNHETKEGMLKFVVVDPDVRGKGVAREMLRLAVKQAFDNPETERVQLNVFPENPRAKRCYEKAGFVVRNLTPDAFTYKDEIWGRCNMIFNKESLTKEFCGMRALIINCSPVRTGATAEIVKLVSEQLSNKYSVKSICIDDYVFAFCRGCRSCHNMAKCVMSDAGVIKNIMREYDEADIIVSVSPSYWADIPGQFKAFIDRCTPWCNTHEPHATIKPGKKGFTIALRTGPNMPECERIIGSIEHFYGHLEIESVGHLGLTSIEYKADVESRKQEILDFCKCI